MGFIRLPSHCVCVSVGNLAAAAVYEKRGMIFLHEHVIVVTAYN